MKLISSSPFANVKIESKLFSKSQKKSDSTKVLNDKSPASIDFSIVARLKSKHETGFEQIPAHTNTDK